MMDRTEQGGVALVGARGTGKSTVGRLLAARLGWPFVDADRSLEERLGVSISEIFATHGEAYFRAEEAVTLQALTSRPTRIVLATGGGAILRESNRELLRRFGAVVWLTADPAVLAGRLGSDSSNDRPALTTLGTVAEISQILAIREPLYRAAAHLVVTTDGKSADEVAGEILGALGDWSEGGAR